jgi:hypothetical protein
MTWNTPLAALDQATPRRLRSTIFALVVAIMLGLITHGHYAGSGDAVHYMVIAHSVAFDHDFDLSNDYTEASRIITEPAGAHAQPGRSGVLRPVHDVGFPALAAPFFAGAYRLAKLTDRLPLSLRRRAKLDQFIVLRQLVAILMILLTAALAVVFFDATWTLTGQKALAFLWTLLWALSPPILSHGYVFFTEVPSALLALFIYSKLDEQLATRSRSHLIALGLFTGFLFLIHVRNLGLILGLTLIAAWRIRYAIQQTATFVAGLAIMGLLKVGLNLDFWGTLVTTPSQHPGPWTGTTGLLSESTVRAFGLLFDARHGLLFSAPIYLIVPASWLLLARKSPRQCAELCVIVGTYLLFVLLPITNIHGWRAGWSPAARFLVPIAPFLAIAAPLLRWPRKAVGVGLSVLLALQLVLDGFFWGHPMLLWSEGAGPAPFLERLIGEKLAAIVPVWEALNGVNVSIALVVLAGWMFLTWMLIQPAQKDSPTRKLQLQR